MQQACACPFLLSHDVPALAFLLAMLQLHLRLQQGRADTVLSGTDGRQPCSWGHSNLKLNLKLSDSDRFRINLRFKFCMSEPIRHMNEPTDNTPKRCFRQYAWLNSRIHPQTPRTERPRKRAQHLPSSISIIQGVSGRAGSLRPDPIFLYEICMPPTRIARNWIGSL